MKFLLSDDQNELFQAVRDFALAECDAGARRHAFDSDDGFHEGFWKALMEMGTGGITLPADAGGLGLELIDQALVCEALGYVGAPGPYLGHVLAGLALRLAGSAEQQARWLPLLASGAVQGTVALAEEQGRALPPQWRTTLAGGRLNGTKTGVLYPLRAGVIIVGVEGGGLALVEGGATGLDAHAIDAVDRTRRLWNLSFTGTPAEPLAGDGAATQMLIDAALVLLSADSFGGACKALDMAVAYVKEREQFGRPVGAFQGMKHQLANIAVAVEPVRGLYWYAAHAFDHVPEDRTRLAAIAKAHAGERFLQAARDMIEAHGGMGFTWEHDAHIWLKRAMFDYAHLGTPATHRARAADLAGW